MPNSSYRMSAAMTFPDGTTRTWLWAEGCCGVPAKKCTAPRLGHRTEAAAKRCHEAANPSIKWVWHGV